MGMVPFFCCALFIFSDSYRSWSLLCTQAFKFSAPKQTTQEVAILQVKGGLVQKSNMSTEAMQRMRQVVDANRQALVHACFRKMEIPTEVWADAIEVRGIMVTGFDRPWDVTIGTLSSVSAMHAVFGDDLRRSDHARGC